MADDIEYTLIGDDMQMVEIILDPGESVRAEAGAMMIMEDDIKMNTGTGGGIFSGLKRMISGEGFFITSFANEGSQRRNVTFAAPYPGKIIPLDLATLGGKVVCQKDAFLCAADGIDVSVSFSKKIGAGIFGGEGFILQKLEGDGLAFVHAGGTIIEKTLQPGESLRVDTGALVAMTPDIDFDIKFVGGFTNALFGGEGLFVTHLSGPGKVWLQSLPFSRLIDRIHAALPPSGSDD